jgi:hypothetical protein
MKVDKSKKKVIRGFFVPTLEAGGSVAGEELSLWLRAKYEAFIQKYLSTRLLTIQQRGGAR